MDKDIKIAIDILRKGGIILYPTDTIWGIGCDATNAEAVKKIYELKSLEGLTFEEIADKLHLSVRTVENQVYRVNKLLKNHFRSESLS